MEKSKKFAIVIGIILLLFLVGLIFWSCDSCANKEEIELVTTELTVEDVIKSDQVVMIEKNSKWFETCVLMKDFLDEETDGSVDEVVNIFQVANNTPDGYDTQVFKFQHFADGTIVSDSVKGFWLEDLPLVDSLVQISYEEAFELVQEVNLPKPHTKNAILRNPLGPKPVNPQWVFGNIHSQLWVDAVTGDIKESNPAFPDGFKMPLGEWP